MSEVRLNLGAGEIPIDGYTPIDRANGDEAYPLDCADNSVDVIRASHLLEHFSHGDVVRVLQDWVRCLKPGGALMVSVPDFDTILEHYVHGGSKLPVESCIMGGHSDENDRHGAIFNYGKLKAAMMEAGLRCITRWTSDVDDCAALPISLNLMGRKFPDNDKQMRDDIIGCITRPRYTDSDASECLEDMRVQTGIRVVRFGGVFWNQGLEKCIRGALDRGAKYILTMDYDTVFTPNDVRELYATMELRPDINALVPMQMRRDSVFALMTLLDDDGQLTTELDPLKLRDCTMPIRSGHFGLTLIRADVFRDMPQPWFVAQPGKNPKDPWAGDQVDADVYFWLQQTGIHVANHVTVGHVQRVVTWPDKHLQPLHQYVPDYINGGKPEGAL